MRQVYMSYSTPKLPLEEEISQLIQRINQTRDILGNKINTLHPSVRSNLQQMNIHVTEGSHPVKQ